MKHRKCADSIETAEYIREKKYVLTEANGWFICLLV